MFRFERRSAGLPKIAVICATGLSLALASCATPPAPPPPPPPPPPKVVRIPPRPMPPDGAAPTLQVPAADASGLRESVNRNISPAQALWNLRSAYNVAALNCHSPKHAAILENYKVFLKANNKVLAKANRDVDAEFRKEYSKGFVAAREKYMTEVYNHFALPPTLNDFCNAVLAMSDSARTVKPADLQLFAVSSLPSVEVVFDDFYRRYDQWRIDAADWDSKYGRPAQAVALPAAGAAVASAPHQSGG
ncbi:MAG: hypothetical protein KGL48_15295 [Sphingomonadales bacterium]|nr:hypothetical protein [Sphingomonadales bacterium]MDE2567566.1 hypothetical protein [Sphingomonadales bacterium]